MKLHDDHPFSRIAAPYYNIAQESRLPAEVKERQPMLIGIIADGIADVIVKVIHQPAFLYGIYLVESTRDVESYGIHLGVCSPRRYFLTRQPTFVAASVVQLVAVLLRLHGTLDGKEFRQLYLSYAVKLVIYLLLLRLYLLFVRKVLPFASATDSEVFTERHCPHAAVLMKPDHLCLCVGMFLSPYLKVHHVTRYAKRDEYYKVVYPDKTLSLCCNVRDSNVLKNW